MSSARPARWTCALSSTRAWACPAAGRAGAGAGMRCFASGVLSHSCCSAFPAGLQGRSPYRLEGQKTAAFEIVEELGEAPDYLMLPVGNAGNITAYWKGFKEELAAAVRIV